MADQEFVAARRRPKRRKLLAPLAAGMLLAAACGGGDSDDSEVTSSAAAGGTITSDDGDVTIEVAEGSVADDVAISITALEPAADGPETVGTGRVYQLEPDGLELSQPAHLTLTASAADLGVTGEGVPLVSVALLSGEVGEFLAPVIEREGDTVTVEAETEHFSELVFYLDGTAIELTPASADVAAGEFFDAWATVAVPSLSPEEISSRPIDGGAITAGPATGSGGDGRIVTQPFFCDDDGGEGEYGFFLTAQGDEARDDALEAALGYITGGWPDDVPAQQVSVRVVGTATCRVGGDDGSETDIATGGGDLVMEDMIPIERELTTDGIVESVEGADPVVVEGALAGLRVTLAPSKDGGQINLAGAGPDSQAPSGELLPDGAGGFTWDDAAKNALVDGESVKDSDVITDVRFEGGLLTFTWVRTNFDGSTWTAQVKLPVSSETEAWSTGLPAAGPVDCEATFTGELSGDSLTITGTSDAPEGTVLEVLLSDDQRQKVAVQADGSFSASFTGVQRNDSNKVVVEVLKGSHSLAGDQIAGP